MRRSRGLNAGSTNPYSSNRMTGREITSAKNSDTVIVVVNGSPIPSVTGLLPSGIGDLGDGRAQAGISAASAARVAAGRPLLGALSASTIASVLRAIFNTPCWASAVWPSGPFPFSTCF